jgi:alpha,alpha-trehalose phosphorylase
MIRHAAFTPDRWALRETELDLATLAQTESLFALSNGHIGVRGNLDEGEPSGIPGTYLAGFYERSPLPYAEPAYGDPEANENIVNVTNGKVIRLLVDDEPFDIRYGTLLSHERVLDLKAGVLRRTVRWASPAGREIQVSSTRLVSLARRAVVAIRYEVEPLEGTVPVVLQSELVANEPVPTAPGDPRSGAGLDGALVGLRALADGTRGVLVHATRASELSLAAAMDHVIESGSRTDVHGEAAGDLARLTVAADAAAGAPLRIVKFLAYGWSGGRSVPALQDQVAAAIAGARRIGWNELLAEQRSYLDGFWHRADVEVEGDEDLQQAVRFALFHILQAGARGEKRPIAAKGLTGPGYDGHTFWDTESYVLPVLTYTAPTAARDALVYRHRTLDSARQRAKLLGLRGAAFPWRTITGAECSGYWPAGTAAFHINADIADAVLRYLSATEDREFAAEAGLEILAETARLWRSLGHHDAAGRFRIDGVTGPDEYSAIHNNNVYTNLMAQRNLRAAADVGERLERSARDLGVDPEVLASWRDAAESMVVPYDESMEVHEQAETFTQFQRWDFASTPLENYPLFLHYPYFDLYRKQVVKQADLVLAMHLRGDAFTDAQKSHNFSYYEGLTVRDSSLSACTQAVIAAEAGHMQLAYDYFGEAALIDLDDLEHNTRDGLHLAALAGTWIAAVAGFGGMRDHDGELSFKPRLPQELTRLSFGLVFSGRRLRVRVDHRHATYTLTAGEELEITHHGEKLTVAADKPQTRDIPRLTNPGPVPAQPPGRAPARRLRPR